MVRSCYEAGRDGFWLRRWLLEQGIDNMVVDSASIEVNRRARRAKTDRLDWGDAPALSRGRATSLVGRTGAHAAGRRCEAKDAIDPGGAGAPRRSALRDDGPIRLRADRAVVQAASAQKSVQRGDRSALR